VDRIWSHISGTQPDVLDTEKVVDLVVIDITPLVSWLPDVLSKTYTGLQ
jgi:hypothetical protein